MNPALSPLIRLTALVAACLLAAGCQTIGPGSLPRDRLGYAGAIAESWKELMLLNIVKQRYLDLPVYLDISSVVSSYSLETGINLEANRFPRDRALDNATLGASGSYSESPTSLMPRLAASAWSTACCARFRRKSCSP